MNKLDIFQNISIVIVDPRIPENIGLAARAMKNTGFSNLSLVANSIPKKAIETSKRAKDVLAKAKIYPSLAKAVEDCQYVYGTTRRYRSYREVNCLDNILPYLAARGIKNKVAIVFGRENDGLHDDEVIICDSLFFIPAWEKFPSYNLSFAIGIVCYKLFEYIRTVNHINTFQPALHKEEDALFKFFDELLLAVGKSPIQAKRIIYNFMRIFRRTKLSRKEVELMKKICLDLKQAVLSQNSNKLDE